MEHNDGQNEFAPILFGTGFAHGLESGLIPVVMADHRVRFSEEQHNG